MNMTDQNISQEEQDAARRILDEIQAYTDTLFLINEDGELCRDGQRAVSFIKLAMNQLIEAIEMDEGVDVVANALHSATNQAGRL